MTTTIDIESLCEWSHPVERSTKNGPRMLRTARPTEQFSNAYKAHKEALRAAGIGWSRNDKTGEWTACWWLPISQEVAKAREEAVQASRATDADVDIPCPPGLSYMPFQRAGIVYAASRPGTLIGDEMGLGKTIQAIGLINSDAAVQRVLVFTKASLKRNWQRELQKWLVRKMSVGIADSKCFPTTDIVICNYDIAHKWDKSLAHYWDLVVLDEAQYIKNRKARRTKAIVGYKPSRNEDPSEARAPIPARRRVVLSGTPVENQTDELWTLLNFLDPERWPSYWGFVKRYAGIQHNGFGVQVGRGQRMDELQRILRETVMVRRLKKDVLKELPPKVRQVVEMDPGEYRDEILLCERELLDEIADSEAEARARLELAKASDSEDEWTAAVKALRDVSGAKMGAVARIRHNTALAKVTKLGLADQLLDEVQQVGKAIIFGHHRDVLDHIKAKFGNAAVLVTGETPLPQRDAAVQRFQTDPSCVAFVGSIRACGEGLTLTAASTVLFVEEDWVPGKLSQAEDRAHRIGQKDSVLVKHYVVDGSIDSYMLRTILEKQEVIDKSLDVGCQQSGGGDAAVTVDVEVTIAEAKSEFGSRKQIAKEAQSVTVEQKVWALRGLQMLSGMCDGARELDGHGFSKIDVAIGKSLACQNSLSDKQAVIAARLVNKYRRQLPAGLVAKANGESE